MDNSHNIHKYYKIAKKLFSDVIKAYDYIYDPDHKKKPSGGGWEKTEQGWSKDVKDEELKVKPSFELKEKYQKSIEHYNLLNKKVNDYAKTVPDEFLKLVKGVKGGKLESLGGEWEGLLKHCGIGGEKAKKKALEKINQFIATDADLKSKNESILFFKTKSEDTIRANIIKEGHVDIFPKQIYKYLPNTIGFDVEVDGVQIQDNFGNKEKSIEAKMSIMANLVKRKQDIEKKIEVDLKSKDEKTKMCAVITKIGMLTGIRTGDIGNKATIKDDKGNKMEVDTYGATTLLKKHVKELKDSKVVLDFVGKKGTQNMAEMEDSEVAKVLSSLVKDKQDDEYIFKTKDGKNIDNKDVNSYLDSYGITFTDFRKFNATTEIYSNLKKDMEKLYFEIAQMKEEKKKTLIKKVTDLITKELDSAYKKAQQKLSHESVSTTINSYVNPMVILNWLSTGELKDKFDDAITNNGKMKLSFNVDSIIAKAQGMYYKAASSGEIINITVYDKSGNVFENIEDKLESLYNRITIE